MEFALGIQNFIQELRKRNPLLFALTALNLSLLLLFFLIIPFDSRQILGITPWIRPIKFTLSFSLYIATMAWILPYLKISSTKFHVISWLVAIFMFIEVTAIVLQTIKGELYHFNWSQPLSEAICYNFCLFTISNIIIVANMFLGFYVFYLFFRETEPLPSSYLWGIRLGLAIYLLSCIEGGFIAIHDAHFNTQPIHGSFSIPFFSRFPPGDLKTSHFFGIHAMQVIPFFGYLFKDYTSGKVAIFATAAAYLGIFGLLFFQAVRWIPFV